MGTSPSLTLDVNGSGRFKSTLNLNSTTLTNGNYLVFNNGVTSYAVQQIDYQGSDYFRLGRNG